MLNITELKYNKILIKDVEIVDMDTITQDKTKQFVQNHTDEDK